jgi:hypothetical protein
MSRRGNQPLQKTTVAILGRLDAIVVRCLNYFASVDAPPIISPKPRLTSFAKYFSIIDP